MGSEFRLDGKVVLVTGAGSGIGKATALAVACAGADVALTELPDRLAAGEETARAIRERGREAALIVLDQTQLGQIDEAVDAVVSRFGHLDVLVNNAGMGILKPALDHTESDWDVVVDTDLKGPFFCAQRAARRMIGQGSGGRIVNVASTVGARGLGNRVAYCAAKAGLINVTRVLAIEWVGHGINVNAVAPGYVLTSTAARQIEDRSTEEEILRRIPMKHAAEPDQIANAIIYLASPAASYVTGQTLFVDGGWTAW